MLNNSVIQKDLEAIDKNQGGLLSGDYKKDNDKRSKLDEILKKLNPKL